MTTYREKLVTLIGTMILFNLPQVKVHLLPDIACNVRVEGTPMSETLQMHFILILVVSFREVLWHHKSPFRPAIKAIFHLPLECISSQYKLGIEK